MKYLFTINPISGDQDKKPFRALLKRYAYRYNLSFDTLETTGEDDVSRLRERISQSEPDRVAVVGGDGTVHMVASALEGRPLPLGIIPMGSANGIAKELGIPVDEQEALHAFLLSRYKVDLDMIRINGEHLCIHFADIGINAQLVEDYNILGREFELRTNKRGYFHRELDFDLNGHQGRWGSVQYRLAGRPEWQTAEMMISHPTNIGVISDIDDTIITSHSTLPLRKFYLMVTRNAHGRHPTPELHLLMESLRGLNEGRMPEDFFYVSDSEWNLYDFLVKFFEVHELPKGAFHLRSFQQGFLDALRPDPPTGNTKLDRIDHLFRFYPSKHFILMGDTSQQDMSIYATIARQYGQRVKGILIRKVKRAADPEKIARYKKVYRELKVPYQIVS